MFNLKSLLENSISRGYDFFNITPIFVSYQKWGGAVFETGPSKGSGWHGAVS
jgi:hypothetical protein